MHWVHCFVTSVRPLTSTLGFDPNTTVSDESSFGIHRLLRMSSSASTLPDSLEIGRMKALLPSNAQLNKTILRRSGLKPWLHRSESTAKDMCILIIFWTIRDKNNYKSVFKMERTSMIEKSRWCVMTVVIRIYGIVEVGRR